MEFILIYMYVLVIFLPMGYRYLTAVSFRVGPDAAIKETPVYLCWEVNPGLSAHNQ
jgi:hypothetical protein